VPPTLAEAVRTARRLAREEGCVLSVAKNCPTCPALPYLEEWDAPSGQPLAAVLEFAPLIHVYPSGLAIDAAETNWVWQMPGHADRTRFMQGTAWDAERYCRRAGIDPLFVVGVPHFRIRGTCVFVEGPSFARDPRDWRLVQSVSFPYSRPARRSL
jgi:hypothetical protein